MKIRAAVLQAIGAERPYDESQPLAIEELELDPPGDGEVLVRIRAAGLCHSDLSVIDGTPVHHHLGVSAFADHAVVSRHSLVPIDPRLPFEHAALFGCAVLTGVGAAVNSAGIRPGQSVAVVGLGGVGLNAVLGALVAGAGEVVALDLDDDKLALAESLGATWRSTARRRMPRSGSAWPPAAGSTWPSRWPAPSRPWPSPTPSPGGAG